MQVLSINGINLKSKNKANINNTKILSKPSIQVKDQVSFGNVETEASEKSFAVVREIFAILADNAEYRGIHKELNVFGERADRVVSKVKNEIFPLFDKSGVTMSDAKNDGLGQTELIRYKQDPIAQDIHFDQLDKAGNPVNQLIINPKKQTVEIKVETQDKMPLVKHAFYRFSDKLKGLSVDRYNNSRKEVLTELDSYRTISG